MNQSAAGPGAHVIEIKGVNCDAALKLYLQSCAWLPAAAPEPCPRAATTGKPESGHKTLGFGIELIDKILSLLDKKTERSFLWCFKVSLSET